MLHVNPEIQKKKKRKVTVMQGFRKKSLLVKTRLKKPSRLLKYMLDLEAILNNLKF